MARTSTHIAFAAALGFALFFAPNAFGAPADRRAAEAARSGDWEAMQAAVRQHAAVNDALADGTTALHWAVFRGSRDAVDTLIRAGARVDATDDNGIAPLALACGNGDAPIANLLLAAGANPNLARPSGETPMMTAARSGNPTPSEHSSPTGRTSTRRNAPKGRPR